MKNRVGRAIVGILALILLGFYTYRQEQIHWHSADVESWGPATGLHPEGFESGVVMNAQPEAPVQTDFSTPAPLEPAPAEVPAEIPAPEAAPTEAPLRFDLSDWKYMLVNGDHSIDQYAPENLVYLNMTADETDLQTAYNPNRIAVDARIAEPLLQMALDCKAAGLPVFLSSGYRSYSEQAANFTRICQNNGITDGKDANGHYITMPAGCSEHQTGLCCDITDRYREIKNDEIFATDTFAWLRDHCADYGFILRFPTGKEDITGVMNEGWHFRYVGDEAARYIMDNGLTLEEFWQQFGGGANV
ncbi:MAG: D-alanyl-D-alanine carboxypeptidase family protein [Oscillospiraceae bacterium]|nr:D-alanyl-D-alanine carboxypeptidase family protein [Oscillospiraceae bacterium]